MKLSGSGRLVLASTVSAAVLLGMTACGGGTIGYLWVLTGKQVSNSTGNAIAAYKIDDYTGNLTPVVGSPFSAGATNPVMGLVKPGGRYVYVLNADDPNDSVSEYSVGGDGTLAFEEGFATQGGTPQWMDISTDGNYLYVLDKVGPNTTTTCSSPTGVVKAPCGAVTVFSIDPTTGRLTLVQNSTDQVNGTYITYFPTGPAPTRIKTFGGAILVLNGDQTITAFTNGSSGQLLTTANSTQTISPAGSPVQISSITSSTSTGGAYLYLTDALNNRILQYTVGTAGVLQPVTGGVVNNFVPNVKPVWTLTENRGTFVYVLNQGNTSQLNANSSISVYAVNPNGLLQQAPTTINPFPVGANPTCMVEDPTNQYVYTSNQDGTVTGYVVAVQNTGQLTTLVHGSTFQTGGKPTCLFVSNITS